MATLSYATTMYYRHSGRAMVPAVIGGMALSALVAIAIGAVYAYVDLYMPIGGWVTFLITMGAGLGLAFVLRRVIRLGKVRNVPVALTIACVAALLLVASSWEFYVFALLQRDKAPVTFFELLFNPTLFGRAVAFINEHGAWSMSGATPTGIFLTLLWLIEAGILVGVPISAAYKTVNELPFCEQCNRWCGTRSLARIAPGSPAPLRTQLEQKQFAALAATGKSPSTARFFHHVYLQGCSNCDTTQTLCVDEVTLTTDNKGRVKTALKPIVKRLRLAPEDTVAVAIAIATLEPQPARSAPEDPPRIPATE